MVIAYNYITGGVDFTDGLYNVSFPAGMTNASFSIVIMDDNILESDEQFQLNIIGTQPPSDHITNGNPNYTKINIADDDGKSISLIFFICMLSSSMAFKICVLRNYTCFPSYTCSTSTHVKICRLDQ